MIRPGSVQVVDAEAGIDPGALRLLASVGYAVEVFASAQAYEARDDTAFADCLLVHAAAPASIGCDAARFVELHGAVTPVVYVAHDPDVRAAVRAMKAGAADYLAAPVRDVDLLGAIAAAAARAAERRREKARRDAALARVARLTRREREIFDLVLTGRLNKQIADALGSQVATVKVHRSRLMRKLGVRSLVELLGVGHDLAASRAPAWDPHGSSRGFAWAAADARNVADDPARARVDAQTTARAQRIGQRALA
jgi:FixJ family two-component response regulator